MISLLTIKGRIDLFAIKDRIEKGTEESAAHSDSLGNSKKSGKSPPRGSVSSSCQFELFLICLHCSRVMSGKCFWIF